MAGILYRDPAVGAAAIRSLRCPRELHAHARCAYLEDAAMNTGSRYRYVVEGSLLLLNISM